MKAAKIVRNRNMSTCCCSLAGTAACRTCKNNYNAYTTEGTMYVPGLGTVNDLVYRGNLNGYYGRPETNDKPTVDVPIIEFKEELQFPNGDYGISFKCPEWVIKLLKWKYGDNYEKELGKEFEKYIMDLTKK